MLTCCRICSIPGHPLSPCRWSRHLEGRIRRGEPLGHWGFCQTSEDKRTLINIGMYCNCSTCIHFCMETFHRDGSVCLLVVYLYLHVFILGEPWLEDISRERKKKHMRHGYWIELQWDPKVSGPFCVSLSYFSRCWGISIWNTLSSSWKSVWR